MATAPTPPTAAPTAPDRADRATFSARATAWADYQKNNLVPEMSALATNAYTNALDAATQAGAAQASATASDASATLSAGMAAAAGATAWVSGTTYTVGNVRYSLVDFQSYRRKTAGAGTTDPSLDITNWAKVTFGTSTGGATITTSTTLTNASPAAMSLAVTAPGHYLTLPNATTCSTGAVLFAVTNASDFDVGIKDSAGTQLGWVRARTGAVIGLADSTTAAGLWTNYGLQKIGATAQFSSTSIAPISLSNILQVVIDTTRTLIIFGGDSSGAMYGVVYNSATQSWGSPVSIRATPGSVRQAILSATNQVLVVSANGTAFQAVTLTLAGTAITVNTAATATLANAASVLPSLVAVGSSWVVGYVGANVAEIRALTISGTTVTIGAATSVNPGAYNFIPLFVSGSVVRTITQDTGTNVVSFKPYTISGTTITAGTAVTVASNLYFQSFANITQNGNGNLVVLYPNSSSLYAATVVKLTGTTEAASTVTLNASYTAQRHVESLPIAAGKTAVFYIDQTSRDWGCNIVTDTAGTASIGTAVSGIARNNITAAQAIAAASNTARFGLVEICAQLSFDCSGTSPVLSGVASYGAPNATLNQPGGYFAQTNLTAERPLGTLLAGSSLYRLGAVNNNGIETYDLMATPGRVDRIMPPTFARGSGVNGAATNEFWSSFAANDAATAGIQITRIEAAQ